MGLKKVVAGLASVAALLMLVVSGSAADTTVVVSGDTAGGENQPGWLFNRDPNNVTPFEFNFDEASIGAGSLNVLPISANGPDKFIGEYFYLGTVEDFDSVSYDFLIGDGGDASDANQFYLNVYANLPTSAVTAFYDCRFDYIPSSGSTLDFSTFSIDKTTIADNVKARNNAVCPMTLENLPAGSTIRMFSLNVGDTNANDAGLDGYLDNVILSSDGMTTTFDFDPAPQTKDDCKNGGWQDYEAYDFKNEGECVSFVASNGRSQGQ
ncbi:hypothetical protein BH23CHL2_BH23CHL2_10410 [soil metagenome]